MDELFKTHLQNHSLNGLSSINKSDLHNHFGKGGNNPISSFMKKGRKASEIKLSCFFATKLLLPYKNI